MDKSTSLREQLKSYYVKKTKDYTYIIVFFLIFSLFIFFAIRPSLITAISLTKDEIDLRAKDHEYEDLISRIVEIQSELQNNQDKIHLIEEALPDNPGINQLLSDIREASEKNSLTVKNLTVENVALIKKSEKELNDVEVSLEATSEFKNVIAFTRDLVRQRRVKMINRITIEKETKIGTGSSVLKVNMKLVGYYL